MGKEIHVAKYGCDTWAGSLARPLLTIQAAAELARPGDTVTVHEGIYRERVNPRCGGSGPESRITYQAAPDEKVVISGGERISGWQKVEGSVYRVVLDNEMFGAFNPYREVVWGDWFESDRVDHLGEVYINGRSLFEVNRLEDIKSPKPSEKAMDPAWSMHVWYCEVDDQHTTLYANFGGFDPNAEDVEINVRRYCFWPDDTGLNWITVRGFKMTMAATNWAPPSAMQEGLIGPHWSKGWIIENNEICNSKCSGISLGKEISTGHNEWVLRGDKHGTQYQRDAVFNALRIGWSKETIGSHIIRNNIIHDCEQTGICGHMGCVFSEIHDNHIFNIHTKRMFAGAEIGGIKLHAPLDVLIRNNHVHHCDRGFWMDWQAQGTRITGNLMYDNDIEDIYVEVSHGPYIIDNNILLSMKSIKDMSHGGAYVHNLFGGFLTMVPVPDRFTPYHFPHDTAVAGVIRIMGGDNRFMNNIFLGSQNVHLDKEKSMDLDYWYHAGAKENMGLDGIVKKGLSTYETCPTQERWDKWRKEELHWVQEFTDMKLPMHCVSNLYYGDAQPFAGGEQNSQSYSGKNPQATLKYEEGSIWLELDIGDEAHDFVAEPVTSDVLGYAIHSKARFENNDGSPVSIETDFFGNLRPKGPLIVGPFPKLDKGCLRLKVGSI